MAVIREDDGPVTELRIEDESGGNSLKQETVDALVEQVGAAEKAGQQAVILTGSGRFFCAGGDINVLRGWGEWEPAERLEYLEGGPHKLSRALRETELATVAAINGIAFGAGLDLTMLCDVRVASETARFCESYINVAVVPGDGGTWLLPRFIGLGRAMHLLLSGDEFTPEQALEWGLVTRMTEADGLREEAHAVAKRLAGRNPRTRRMIRQMVFDAADQSVDQHFGQLGTIMATVAGSAAHREAIEAVLAR